MVTRIEKSNRRRCSRLAPCTVAALISTSSGRSSHLELYCVLRRNSETRSLDAAHPAIVTDLLKAQVQANAFIKSNPTQAQADANAELATYTGKSLKPDLVAASFKEITFTNDPNAASLKTAADQAVALGLLKPVNLDGIYALDPLNKVLAAAGESQISS